MTTIIIPGIGGSGEEHWQTRWQRADSAALRLAPASWDTPDLADWRRALDVAVAAADAPVLLVAHSLGCLLVAHWARGSARRAAVRGAFLVAMPDPDAATFPAARAGSFGGVPDVPLPFPALVMASDDDPYCGVAVTRRRARCWDAGFVALGAVGHVNTASGHGPWPEGKRLLAAFTAGFGSPRP